MSPARIIILVVALVAGLGAALLMQRRPDKAPRRPRIESRRRPCRCSSPPPTSRSATRSPPAICAGSTGRSPACRPASSARTRRPRPNRSSSARSPATPILGIRADPPRKADQDRRHRLPLRRASGRQARHRHHAPTVAAPTRPAASSCPMTASTWSAPTRPEGASRRDRRRLCQRDDPAQHPGARHRPERPGAQRREGRDRRDRDARGRSRARSRSSPRARRSVRCPSRCAACKDAGEVVTGADDGALTLVRYGVTSKERETMTVERILLAAALGADRPVPPRRRPGARRTERPVLNVGASEHAIARKLDLSIGRSLVVELPRDAKEVFVANPEGRQRGRPLGPQDLHHRHRRRLDLDVRHRRRRPPDLGARDRGRARSQRAAPDPALGAAAGRDRGQAGRQLDPADRQRRQRLRGDPGRRHRQRLRRHRPAACSPRPRAR